MLAQMDKDVKSLQKEIMQMCWYMRGGITLNEAYMLSPEERKIINEIIKENLDTTKKTQMPFF